MSIIRRATTEDINSIVTLMYAAYKPIRDLGIHFESAHPTIEKVSNNIKQNICYVYEVDNKLIGTISLRMPWSHNPGHITFLIFGGLLQVQIIKVKESVKLCSNI